jgi:GTP cyclohydrolase I
VVPVDGTNGKIEAAVRQILVEIGEDPERDGLRRTPERMHRMYRELTAGYHVDPGRLINRAVFDVDYSEMVVVKDVRSTCCASTTFSRSSAVPTSPTSRTAA